MRGTTASLSLLLALSACAAPAPPAAPPSPPALAPPAPPAPAPAAPAPSTPPPPESTPEPEPGAPSAALRLRHAAADLGENVTQGSGAPPHVEGPSVDVGPVKAPPGMREAERVVAELRSRFKACYNRALKQDPDMSGTAGLDMKVGPEGAVTSVSVTGGKGLSPGLVACLSGVAQRAQFSRPPAGSATLSIPFTITH